MYNKKGFTLIELLVVMGVFLAVATVVGGILFSTLRGSQKSTTIDEIRHNGNFAITTMTKMIRGAKNITYPTNCLAPTPTPVVEVRLTPADGSSTTIFTCDNTNKTISSNSASLLDMTRVSLVAGSCSFTCTQLSGQSPTVRVKFSLSQSGTSSFVESQAVASFDTSVTLRNP